MFYYLCNANKEGMRVTLLLLLHFRRRLLLQGQPLLGAAERRPEPRRRRSQIHRSRLAQMSSSSRNPHASNPKVRLRLEGIVSIPTKRPAPTDLCHVGRSGISEKISHFLCSSGV